MLPSTLMGPGWQPRGGTLASDIGTRWTACGQSNEWDPLRHVLLIAPPESLAAVTDASDALFIRLPDIPRLHTQLAEVAAAYRSAGVTVTLWTPPADAPPNVIFARDLLWMTPEGAVIARPAARQRAGEERIAAQAVASLGIPIRATLGAGTFEGADALWLAPDHVLVGVGRRTDHAALLQLVRIAIELGVRVEPVPIPEVVQHLLGAVNLLDRDLAAVHPAAGRELRSALAARNIVTVDLLDPTERDDLRSINFVALGPRSILLPARCPHTRTLLQSHGVTCQEVEVSEYVAAAGALGCITAILHRAA